MNEKQQTIARVILFVGLAWLVILVTPRLFPGPPRQFPDTTITAGDSGAAARVATPGVVTPGSTGTVPVPTVTPGAAAGGQAAITLPPPATAADSGIVGQDSLGAATLPVATTLVIVDSLASWSLNSVGARVSQVELHKYRRLSGEERAVTLLRPEEAMVRYHLRIGGQTISLNNVPFQTDTLRAANGSVSGARFTAQVPSTAAQMTVEYVVDPANYTIQTRGQLQGAPEGAMLILEMPSGIESGEANPLEDQTHFAVAFKRELGDVQGIPFRKLDPGERRIDNLVPISWIAVKNKYFVIGVLKLEGAPGFLETQSVGGTRSSKTATHVNSFVVDDVSSGSFEFEIYAGPQEFKRLVAMGREFQYSNPYGGIFQPVVQPFAVIVMKALLWLKAATNLNYGWVLVIFGVIVRLALWPLNQKAMRSSMRMQRLQPELTEIQAKYKGNPQKQQEEIMRVYRDHGMTPFSPLAGCLPMLIPMPVFFALFFVFQSTIEFRGVPFLWLPDISLKDPLYIVPVFMGVSMYVMSWMGMRNAPQTPQTKMLLYGLPVMMMVLFMNFASGLNLYYAVQNVAALPQQWLLSRERVKSGLGVASAGKSVATAPHSAVTKSKPKEKG